MTDFGSRAMGVLATTARSSVARMVLVPAVVIAGLGIGSGAAAQGEGEPTPAPAPQQQVSTRQIESWTSDRRNFQVGDVISVLLDEYTMASANRNVTAEQERTRRLGVGASADGTGASASFETENSGRSRDRGQSTRHDRLAGEMTVRVVEVDPRGLMRIEGTKRVKIDDHEQELTLTGFVRPEDVPAHNVLESWRIADAEIQYASTGDLGKPKGGFLSRILGWIWP